jgi:hypothetical protein
MRRMILRMIATGSLSAFSASVLHGFSGAREMAGSGATGAAAELMPARAQAAADSATPAARSASPGPSLDSGAARLGTASPDRLLPRGSLLDLSV